MAYTFVEAREGYSLYRDDHGENVYFASRMEAHNYYDKPTHFGANQLTVTLALHAAHYDRLGITEAQALLAPDTDESALVACVECTAVGDGDEYNHTAAGERICEACTENHYMVCEGGCDEWVHQHDTVYAEDANLCEGCADEHTHWCDDCDARVFNDGDHYENHDHDCDCEAPNQNFTLPVLTAGADPIKSDTTNEVRTQGGLVSEAARNQIHQVVETALGIGFPNRSDYATPEEYEKVWHTVMVKRTAIHPAITQMDHAYKTAGGVYAKRLRSAIHKATKGLVANGVADKQFTIDTATVEKVGQIARENSKGVDVKLSITRDLNQSADFFYHDDSCWWTDYSHSRCTLKNNHGFGVRSLGDPWDQGWGAPATGRVWALPCTITDGALNATTSDDTDPDAYVVFNGYGELSETNGPQALAALVGMEVSTHRVSIDADMYVNSAAYVVTTPEYVGEALHFGAHLYQH